MNPGRATIFSSPVTFGGSVRVLIKQGENVKGRPSGSVAQLAECSHGKREALGSSPPTLATNVIVGVLVGQIIE